MKNNTDVDFILTDQTKGKVIALTPTLACRIIQQGDKSIKELKDEREILEINDSLIQEQPEIILYTERSNIPQLILKG